jgi:hypothetical protein
MDLTPAAKAHYWALLLRFAQQYIGSASLGNPKYQHLGLIFGPQPTSAAQGVLTQYATTNAVDGTPTALFDALHGTHVVRAAWPVQGGGYYFEFWSAYLGVTWEESNTARSTLLQHLDTLALAHPA